MNALHSASRPAAHTPAVRIPKTGEIAPDFELPDSTGALRKLSELAAHGALVLLFYRGHW